MGGTLTILKEQIGKGLSITLSHDLREARYNALCLLLSITVCRNLDPKNIGSGKHMIVLEIIHEVVGDGRFWINLDLDMVDDDFGLDIGSVHSDWESGDGSHFWQRQFCKCVEGDESPPSLSEAATYLFKGTARLVESDDLEGHCGG
jgi:hypothetical protein